MNNVIGVIFYIHMHVHCMVLVVCGGNTSIHAIHIYAYVLSIQYSLCIHYTLCIQYDGFVIEVHQKHTMYTPPQLPAHTFGWGRLTLDHPTADLTLHV